MRRLQPEPPATEVESPLVVPDESNGVRLDAWLAEVLGVGRRAAARLAERARVNGRQVGKGVRLATGDRVSILQDRPVEGDFAAQDPVLRLGRDVIVLDKAAGPATTALAGRPGPSLAAWLAMHHPECRGVGRAGESGLVHRLDTATSGLVLAARSQAAYDFLREQFQRHEVEKTYLALVQGRVSGRLTLAGAIGQHAKSHRRMRVVPDSSAAGRYSSQTACSIVEPVRPLADTTLVRIHTSTGVRHQVRVHLASAGHPLLGDALYGGRPVAGVEGHLLHAESLAWRDPDGQANEARSDLPARWEGILAGLTR